LNRESCALRGTWVALFSEIVSCQVNAVTINVVLPCNWQTYIWISSPWWWLQHSRNT
jgi:hypothetical protein